MLACESKLASRSSTKATVAKTVFKLQLTYMVFQYTYLRLTHLVLGTTGSATVREHLLYLNYRHHHIELAHQSSVHFDCIVDATTMRPCTVPPRLSPRICNTVITIQ